MADTVPTKLSLYNGALEILGQTRLSSLTENTPRRHKLDAIWDRNFLTRALNKGQWDFAMRVQELTSDASIDPAFGREHYFNRPADCVRLMALSTSEYFYPPLTGDEYRREGDYWVCDFETLYCKFVSNDDSYGKDYTLWPEEFTEFVEAYLALRAEPTVTQGDRLEIAKAAYKEARDHAKSVEAQEAGSKRPTRSRWASARGGGRGRSRAGDIISGN